MCRQAHIGVYIGVSGSSYFTPSSSQKNTVHTGVYSGGGHAISILSGRMSFVLGLTGPNFPVDTACSATLVALHCADSSIRLGECFRAAVCGLGILEGSVSIGIARGGMTSLRGRCHTFD
jgi:acyl transferase domain-containing protein